MFSSKTEPTSRKPIVALGQTEHELICFDIRAKFFLLAVLGPYEDGQSISLAHNQHNKRFSSGTVQFCYNLLSRTGSHYSL